MIARLARRGSRERPENGVVKVRAEHMLRRCQPFRRKGSLAPTHHLAIEPSGLDRVGSRGAGAPNAQIALALPHQTVRADLEPAVEAAPDDFGGVISELVETSSAGGVESIEAIDR